ncbi:unnamed protein product [Camellia sinensis]
MKHTLQQSSPTWPEKLSCDRKKAIQDLIQGRELANQLRLILRNPFSHHDESAAAGDLLVKILGSFTDTISILNRTHEVSAQIQANSPPSDARKFEDSDDSSKTSGLKDRRGCYKRRKTSQTWTKTTPALIDDGHAWRKYGQKVILNAKHPRNYFRCTHKFDQGCQATKQVQKTEDDPEMYRTTYHGHHTCRNLLKSPPHFIFDSTPNNDSSSLFLSFGSNNKSHEPFSPNNNFPMMKQECKCKEDDHKPTTLFGQYNQSSSSDYLLSPDLTTFESSGPMTVSDHDHDHDHGDVISCTASPNSHGGLDTDDFIVGAVDFDDACLRIFNFD